MNMELKDSCRLCLSKGEFYELFDASHGGCTLADELNTLLDFKIENKKDLPNIVCSNCYKINSFFKEFRRSCARVKDRLNRLLESQNSNVSVKLEKTDELEEELSSKHSGEKLETLRSTFRGSCVSRVDVDSDKSTEVKGTKRRKENSEDTIEIQGDVQDPLLTIVKSECISDEEQNFDRVSDFENDSCQFSAVNDETSLGVSDSGRKVNSNDSASNSSNLRVRTSSQIVDEDDKSPQKKKPRRSLEENDCLSNGRECSGSPFMYDEIAHEVKQEEIEIFDPPFEDENDFATSEDQESPEKRMYSSDGAESNASSSSSNDVEDGESSSSSSSGSSDESDEDTEMLLCLALLLIIIKHYYRRI